ncbi:MAG: hypothetical protein JW959_02645 [Pirellulales bacterium]|nr:hypothetical protein [Pirellulales bacterium]
MSSMAFRALLTTFSHVLICATCLAQGGITADLHPWGRFEPGAWKLVRVLTETLDEKGQVVSTTTTDTKTTLMNIDDEGVALEVQVCMEVAGKKFQAEPQTVKQNFNGELAAADATLKELEDEHIVVEDRKIACKVQQIEIAAANEKTVVNIYYSTEVAPYLLKRTSIVRDAEKETELSSTVYEAIASDMPVRLRGETHAGAFVRTVCKNANGKTTTLAVVLPDVPGGVFRNSSKEVDNQGRIVQRSTLELVDYGTEPEEDRLGVFLRKRAARRAAKAMSRRGQ